MNLNLVEQVRSHEDKALSLSDLLSLSSIRLVENRLLGLTVTLNTIAKSYFSADFVPGPRNLLGSRHVYHEPKARV